MSNPTSDKAKYDNLKAVDIRSPKVRSLVLPALSKLFSKYPSNCDEFDVFHSLVSKESYLYLNEFGFLVLREDIDKFTREKILFVWVAFAFEQDGNFLNNENYRLWLLDLMKEIGAVKMQFCSPRKGYEKQLPNFWRQKDTVYEWSLNL